MCDDGAVSKDDSSPLDIRYGERLRTLREDRGFTQAVMVDHMRRRGVPYMNTSTLSRIEAGTRPVRLSEARVISTIFDVDMDAMIDADEAYVMQQSRHRYARNRYVAFRDDVTEVTRSQLQMEKYDLALLRDLLDDETNPGIRAKIELAIENVESYLRIDLSSEAADIVQKVRDDYVANEETSTGRYLNATSKMPLRP